MNAEKFAADPSTLTLPVPTALPLGAGPLNVNAPILVHVDRAYLLDGRPLPAAVRTAGPRRVSAGEGSPRPGPIHLACRVGSCRHATHLRFQWMLPRSTSVPRTLGSTGS